MEALFIALILGLVEGLTEFLPISSTGHLIIATDLLNLNQEALSSFNIIIQFGAILAVVYLYWDRFYSFFHPTNLINLKNTYHEKKLNLIHIALAIVPVLAIGFVTRKFIKAHLFNTTVVTLSLVIVGLIIIIVEKIKPKAEIHSLDEISYKNAFLIGLGQCFALIPGVSRSGATMLTAMTLKTDVKTSADFSFLISVPVIAAATLYELLKSYQSFTSDSLVQLAVGFIVSFIVAIFSIKFFLHVLKKLSLTPFAIYRILFGLLYFFLKIKAQ